ncbi:MAG TPA: hypothetical protein PLD59_05865 [Tepidisphaeraceae bacterium]|nr:hypothetical protein [Tepidisphaeraceae bacterium]
MSKPHSVLTAALALVVASLFPRNRSFVVLNRGPMTALAEDGAQ